ncbi:MAG TPA: flagellar hook capping FlgD N-terminal domain-containing protein [Bryobacteraceae bacterium]|jgi:flagellar basal-body rod modification protein FlgD|nr:flagellar hook capping FlgD N-terminal domain-containing protein [Bryobacteraceae bacterium]
MSPIPSTSSTTSTPSAASSSGVVNAATVSSEKNMFLQLLVAQLKNQDPTQPMDSSTFVTQLAQFQQLESTVNMGQDVTAIRTDADKLSGVSSTSSTDGSSNTDTSGNTGI